MPVTARSAFASLTCLIAVAACAPAAPPIAQPPVSTAQASPTSAAVPATVDAAPGATATTYSQAMTKIQLALGFVPSVQSAPFYMAQDKGYYAAEGLDVELKYGTIQNLLQSVSSGEIAFASASGDSLMPQRQQGVAVTYVLTFWNRNPIGALGLAGNSTPPLRTPADLKGKSVGVSAPNSSTDFGLKALLRSAKLADSDVNLVAISTTEVEALIQKRIDVAMTFLPNESAQMKSLGLPVETIAVSDYLNLVAPGFVAGDKLIKEHPEIVQKFVNATLRGLRDTLASPSDAFESSLERMPELSVDNQPLQRDVLTATLQYYTPVQGRPTGTSDPDAWVKTQDFMQSIGVIDHTIDPKDYYTNMFVDSASP